MYRGKESAKPDRALGSLQSALAEHARNITPFSQPSNDLIASISFFLSCSFRWAFQAHSIERSKLIPSGVPSLFLLDIERFKLTRRSKPIPSYHIEERSKLIPSGVPSLFLLVECHWSRLTSGSGLLHSRACPFHAIVADSLRLPFKQANYRVTGSVGEVNRCLLVRACNASQDLFRLCLLHACSRACSVRAYYTHVVGLVPFVPTAFDRACSFEWRARRRGQSLSALVAGSLSGDWLDDEVNHYLPL